MVPGTPVLGDPDAEAAAARELFLAVHRAIREGLVRSCHDLSEGGLAAGLAEMCLAGDLGADVSLRDVPTTRLDDGPDPGENDGVLLFAESPSRFVLEVRPGDLEAVSAALGTLPWGRLGTVSGDAPARLVVRGVDGGTVIAADVADLKAAWQRPLHEESH